MYNYSFLSVCYYCIINLALSVLGGVENIFFKLYFANPV